ncbi:AAA family ATPase [Companilactobacillus suantsaicola]|uniref:AAA family ATPase n=1 Tax=Companilactobacillus suantsaicola TaxID=2487723 RepID=A0A4Z0JPV5_9LACO|nr:ATP-binding protein [Companilactobacillus suantsaicola]TGD24095.1 AAA family ATPase [Companilactobacillus suantsaicola]
MESMFGLDKVSRKIALKHGVDYSGIDFKKVISERDKREQQRSIEFTKKNIQVKRKGIFRSSLVSDFNDLQYNFADFKTDTPNQASELKQAKNIANRIYVGETGNFLFTGEPGLGKSMLAVSILNGLNSQDTSLSCYFLSFAMFVNNSQMAFKDEFLKRDNYKVEECVKNCDVLVIDDLGSESSLRSETNEATNYAQRILFRFADYRKNKTNIITTNNTGRELQQLYDPKIISRLMTKKAANTIKFSGNDMRNN